VPKINVYLPDDLAAAVKAIDLPVSAICQKALADAVRTVGKARQGIKALRDPQFDPDEHPRLIERVTDRMTARLRGVLTTCLAAGPVGTRELLIALIDEHDNLGVRLLEASGVDLDSLRASIPTDAESLPASPGSGWSSVSLPARSALATALEASIQLGHNYLGCEHLVVGLAADASSAAGQALNASGVDSAAVRRAIASAAAGITQVRQAEAGAEVDKLDVVLNRLEAIERRLSAANL
jgi:ATP-dependent Clp protease ATP-binding subunit ClpA